MLFFLAFTLAVCTPLFEQRAESDSRERIGTIGPRHSDIRRTNVSWTRYLLHDYFTAEEFNRMDRRVRQMRSSQARSSADLRDRIADLEDDLGRLTLLTYALAEACVRKGVFTREEIASFADELDLVDGRADGKLDPSALHGPGEQRPTRPRSPESHLHDLERREHKTPGQFLSELEEQTGDDAPS
jgi:hypothetical protein